MNTSSFCGVIFMVGIAARPFFVILPISQKIVEPVRLNPYTLNSNLPSM